MSNNQTEEFMESVRDAMLDSIGFSERMRQNLFDADHRNAMIEKYGMSEAEIIDIKDLI